MDSRGNIRELSAELAQQLQEKIDAGKDPGLVAIPEDQLAHVQGMNRHERRKWFAIERAQRRALQRRGR